MSTDENIYSSKQPRFKQISLGRFVLTVDQENKVSFFSILETMDSEWARLLIWKLNEGFAARVVRDCPSSDLQTSKPIGLQEFPFSDLISEIKANMNSFPGTLGAQITKVSPVP